MVEDSPVRIPAGRSQARRPEGRLVACCLTDWAGQRHLAVYSFFERRQCAPAWHLYDPQSWWRGAPPAPAYVYLGYLDRGSRR